MLHAKGMADPIERQNIKLSGDIDFDHVTFRYEGAAEAALKDITLSVKKGQRAAIIGGTGSLTGSIIGAAFLSALPELMREFSTYRMLAYSVVLVLVMLFSAP